SLGSAMRSVSPARTSRRPVWRIASFAESAVVMSLALGPSEELNAAGGGAAAAGAARGADTGAAAGAPAAGSGAPAGGGGGGGASAGTDADMLRAKFTSDNIPG